MVKLFLVTGMNVNTKTNSGMTPLYYAARQGHTEIVKLLIDHNADVNAKSNYGGTPLNMAILAGHTGIVKLLKAAGAKE